MKFKEYRFYFYLALLAAGSGLLVKLSGLNELVQGTKAVHSRDYFSKGYTKWEMDKDGSLKSKLVAEETEHFSDDGTTHMVNPVMTFVNKDAPPWVIQSETSILSADGKDLQMNGKAIIDRAAAEGVKPLRIVSSNLRVNPDTSYAETDEWAELISPPNRTTGTGMEMVFTKPIHLKLLANVKGNYGTN